MQLRQLVLHRPVRQLQRTRDRSKASVWLEQPVEAGDGFLGARARRQAQDDVVETAFHVKGGAERLAIHPENPEPLVIGHELARADAVDVFRREPDADNRQVTQPAVDDGGYSIARIHSMRAGEALARDHLVAVSGFDPTAAPQEDIVDAWPAVGRNRNQASSSGLVELFEVERHVGHDPGFDRRNRRERDLACQPVGRALLDFWQADDGGQYDNAGYRLRGHLFTGSDGRFQLETIVPGLYPGRTRHIHVKVQAPNRPVLTTQLYFPNEPRNQSDGIYDPTLVMHVQDLSEGKQALFDFVLDLG